MTASHLDAAEKAPAGGVPLWGPSDDGSLYKLEARRYQTAKNDWKLLSNYTAKMSSLRNEIAHGTMMNFDHKEMKIVPYATTIPVKEGISIHDVFNRTQLFRELDLAISWYSLALSSLWKPRLRGLVLNRQPAPDLILRLRTQAAQSRGGQSRKRKNSGRRPSRGK